MLTELCYLRAHHSSAVPLVWVVGVIVLMVVFCWGVVGHREHLCHYGTTELLGLVQFINDCFSNCLLFRCVVVDTAAVLCACIVSLTVQSGWVVDHKEDLQYLLQGYVFSVEGHLDNLRMPRVPAAHLPVGGFDDVAIAVPALHVGDALDANVDSLQTPKATSAKCDNLSHSPAVNLRKIFTR